MYKRQVKKVSSQLLHECGHDPSAEEIAERLDMPVDKVREIMRVAQEPVSLETPIGEEEDSHLGDFIPDDDAPVPAEAASQTPVSYTHLGPDISGPCRAAVKYRILSYGKKKRKKADPGAPAAGR